MAVSIAQPHQRLFFWCVPRPTKLLQTMHWIVCKSNPSTLHHLRQLLLRDVGWNAADISGVAKQHFQICSVICAAGGIESGIGPVAEVAVLPDRYAMGSASASLEIVGAREGFQEELIALCLSGVDASTVGWDHIVSLLIVVVAEQLGLFDSLVGRRWIICGDNFCRSP